jgi:hypothetical protein
MQKFVRRLPWLALGCVSVVLSCSGSDKDGTPPDANGGAAGASTAEPFSFFVTSLRSMQKLSGNPDGFGGDLRFGETGDGAGLRGADKICTTIAETSLPGNGKTWRAFLSATQGEDGKPVHAIERVGDGPWYDRAGRLVAENKADLAQVRPAGADDAIVDDLPNEDGVPNHAPDLTAGDVDNHDVLTGTNEQGKLFSDDQTYTCNDWTSALDAGTPHCGHSWPRRGGPNDGAGGGGGMIFNPEGGAFGQGGSFGMMMGGPFPGGGGPMMGIGGGFITGGPPGGPMGNTGSGESWMSALDEAGCAPGAFIIEAGPPGANGTKTVGDGGGYGAIYCFALTP